MKRLVPLICLLTIVGAALSACHVGDGIDTQTGADSSFDTVVSDALPSTDILSELDEEEKETIYQKAIEARDNKEYQYAHALFSLLSREDYKDSAKESAELLSRASATVILNATLGEVIGGKNCSKQFNEDLGNKYSTQGFLYIGEGGTPRFAYVSVETKEIETIIPDTALTNVISITRGPKVLYSTGKDEPYFFHCLKGDGSIEVIYNPNFYGKSYEGEEVRYECAEYFKFIRSLKSVRKFICDEESYTAVFLHADGSVSFYGNSHDERDNKAMDRIRSWTDISDIVFYDGEFVWGIKQDGGVVVENVWDDDEPIFSGHDTKIQYMLPHYTIVNGCVYDRRNNMLTYKVRNADGSESDIAFKNAVYCSSNTVTDVYGNVYLIENGSLLFKTDNVSYLCQVDYKYLICYNDGRVEQHITFVQEYAELLDGIKVEVPVSDTVKNYGQYVIGDSPFDINDLSEEDMDKLYQRALTAYGEKEYQYAYALFSVLYAKGYPVSRDNLSETYTKANAVKVLFTESGFLPQGDKTPSQSVQGFLYVAEGGVPTFVYKENGSVKEYVPDATLKNVISLTEGVAAIEPIYQCLHADGSVSVLGCDVDNELTKFVSELKNVIKISTCDDCTESVYLHSDGSISIYESTKRDGEYAEVIQDILELDDLYDVSYQKHTHIQLLTRDGRYTSYRLSSSWLTSIEEQQKAIEENDTFIPHFARAGLIVNGKLYSSYPDSEYTYSAYDSASGTVVYCKYENVIWAERQICIDINGNVIVDSYSCLLPSYKTDGISYVAYDHFPYFIDANGNVLVSEAHFGGDFAGYDAELLDGIKVEV